jgi:hypothetical protein
MKCDIYPDVQGITLSNNLKHWFSNLVSLNPEVPQRRLRGSAKY